jgi:hypothetical protein
MSESHLARIATDAATAGRLADAFADWLDAAVAAFEQDGGGWTVEIHFESAPMRTRFEIWCRRSLVRPPSPD